MFRRFVLQKVIILCIIILVIAIGSFVTDWHLDVQKVAYSSQTHRLFPPNQTPYTQSFNTKCDCEQLYKTEYSEILGTSIPLPTGRKASCPRSLQAANFTISYTGLLTFPGSGNTWTRHLLQELTGLPTGSTSIPDEVLKKNGFPFEGELERVIAVKSHGKIHAKYDYYVPTNDFSRLIVVIRNPYKCFLSEYKRRNSNGSHITDVRIESDSRFWKRFIPQRIGFWNMLYEDIFDFPGPVFVTSYEDLQSQLLTELIRLSEFLASKDLSEFSFCCALRNPMGNFRRPKSNQTLEDIFPKHDKLRINEVIEKTAILMSEKHPEISKKMYSYRLPI